MVNILWYLDKQNDKAAMYNAKKIALPLFFFIQTQGVM